ncbi:T9SS type A sorting domain-containing protein, partial [Pontibacter toksunensis]
SASLDDNAEACTAIGGGNITIHKPSNRSFARKDAVAAGAAPEGHVLAVYPTSVSDRATLRFSLESADVYTLGIYDIKGALVRSIATGSAEAGRRYEHHISAEGMSRGLYLARLITGGNVQTVKFVVDR